MGNHLRSGTSLHKLGLTRRLTTNCTVLCMPSLHQQPVVHCGVGEMPEWRLDSVAVRCCLDLSAADDDDDDEGQINFSMALSPKTTRTRNNKPKL